jgi:nucleoid-associated protein YgaU
MVAMGLRDKYAHAVQTAKDLRMQGSAEERDGKLYFRGTTQTQDEANKIWDAIKTIPDWPKEIVADIQAIPSSAPAAATTYTVKAGDTLSKIAQQHLGDAKQYMTIFEANRDQLRIPTRSRTQRKLRTQGAKAQRRRGAEGRQLARCDWRGASTACSAAFS